MMRRLPALIALASAACGQPPSLEDRPVSYALRDTEGTALGRAIAPRLL